MLVRPATDEDVGHCRSIVRGLPEYFTDDVPDKVAHDLSANQGWIIVEGEATLGFSIVERRSLRAAEILWMAVHPEHRRRGLGSSLLVETLRRLDAEGTELIEVKTLDRSAGYQPYAATRAFWERHGFVQIDTVDPYPGWQPGNPAAIYVRALGSTVRDDRPASPRSAQS